MPETRLAHFLEQIGAAQDESELTAIASEIEQSDFGEEALEQLADAIREARERPFGKINAANRAGGATSPSHARVR